MVAARRWEDGEGRVAVWEVALVCGADSVSVEVFSDVETLRPSSVGVPGDKIVDLLLLGLLSE